MPQFLVHLSSICCPFVSRVRTNVPSSGSWSNLTSVRVLPDWVPGTGFKKVARQWAAELTDVTERPYAFVKHQMAQEKSQTSFLSRLLQEGEPTPEKEFTDKWSAMALYIAGADTVSPLICHSCSSDSEYILT